jgi:Domain of unknown function (DUF4270)
MGVSMSFNKILVKKNMKNIFIASLSFLVLLIVGACNKSSQLGADLIGDKLNLSFSDTLISVIAATENPDSVLGVNYSAAGVIGVTKLPLGKMYDPIFGVTEARIYTNLTYNNGVAPVLDGAATYILDSANFVLAYNGADTYGDTSQTQGISLYRLDASESLAGDNFTYYTNKRFKTQATRLGGKDNFLARPNSKVRVVKDTSQYDVRPHIAFSIDKNFAKALLDTNIYSTYNANKGSAPKYFRGFEIRSDKTTNAMLSFNIADDSSGLFIYYHKLNDTVKLSYQFRMTSSSFPNFNHDFAKGKIGALYNGKKTIAGDSLLYLQGMAGPNVKFEFPNLKQQLGTAAVNRAELEFTILEDSIDKYLPVEQLILTTANGTAVADLKRTGGAGEFGGIVVTESGNLRRYKCNISQHLQNMLYGTAGPVLYLVPDNNRGAIPNKQETTRRVILYGTKNPKYKTKLNLYYTKP